MSSSEIPDRRGGQPTPAGGYVVHQRREDNTPLTLLESMLFLGWLVAMDKVSWAGLEAFLEGRAGVTGLTGGFKRGLVGMATFTQFHPA